MNKHNDTSIGICPVCGGNLFLTAGKILCYNCDYITNAGPSKKKGVPVWNGELKICPIENKPRCYTDLCEYFDAQECACTHDGAERKESKKEEENNVEEPTMKVSYNGFTGELAKLEKKEFHYRDPDWSEMGYELIIYDAEKKVTHSFKCINLKDVKFLGGSVSFE